MSTASAELFKLAQRAEQDNDLRRIRYTESYRKAYEAAKRIIAEAEAFTQGDEHKRLAMADAFCQQHRTHQQGFVRGVVIPALAALEVNAEQGFVDARNQGATDFAKHALAAADEHNATWMPFI